MQDKVTDIMRQIIAAKFTSEELRQINHLVVEQLNFDRAKKIRQFRLGQKVWFKDRHGVRIDGVVIKINQKTVTVKTGPYHTWRVGGGILNPVE